MQLAKNGVLADLIETGSIVKTAFVGPLLLVPVIHLPTMHSPSDIQQETS